MKNADEGRIKKQIEDSSRCILAMAGQVGKISVISSVVVSALQAGKKIMTAGNGGSAAEALHMSEELIGRFRGDRVSLPCVSLVADPTAITCISNDFGYEHVFSRQVEGLGAPGDVLVLFSTSGKSTNLKPALDAARKKSVKTVSILGRDGGIIAGMADYEIILDGQATERIQEAHQVLMHIILDAVESAFVS